MKQLLAASLLMAGCMTPTTIRHVSPQSTGHAECSTAAAVQAYDPWIEVWLEEFFQSARKAEVQCFAVKSIRYLPQNELPKPSDGVGTIIGYCTGDGRVVLSQEVREERSLLFNKALLYHELGHCVLNLDHAPEDALNLMSPYMLVDDTLAEHWAELMEKLFSRSLSLNEENETDVVFDRHSVPDL